MKLLKPFILITLIISFCLGNEVFTGYSSNQSLIDSIPAKPVQREATTGIILAEIGGGLMGGAGGAIIGGGLGWLVVAEKIFGASVSNESDRGTYAFWTLLGGYIFGTFGSAVGTYIVGNAFHQEGKFLPTLAGSAFGCIILSSVSSVMGYNSSRPKPLKQSFFYQHFDLPNLCFRTEKTKENKIVPVLDFRLVNARF